MTTAASNHVAATLPNLLDGNHIMNHLLSCDIVKSPNLQVDDGKLLSLKGPGFGIELEGDKVKQGAELFDKNLTNND